MVDRTEHWQRLVAAWESSGLTQAEFCGRHSVKAVTFGWWKRKLIGTAGRNRQGRRGRSPARGGRGRSEFVEVSLPGGISAAGSVRSNASGGFLSGYEIILPDGLLIRLADDFDPAKVSALICAVALAC